MLQFQIIVVTNVYTDSLMFWIPQTNMLEKKLTDSSIITPVIVTHFTFVHISNI